jgi:dihydroflavonol-4-reductase
VVFHLAARITLADEDPAAWRLNTEGVSVVARAALDRGARRFVHCSSVHSFDQYSAPGGRICESSPRSTDPRLPVYDRSKYAGEQCLRAVVADGLDAVICNPTGVFGPVDHGPSRMNGMLRDAARGRVPAVVTGAFDFVDVRDVVRSLAAAAERGRTGENYLLPGHRITMLEVFRQAADASGHVGPLFAFPLRTVRAFAPIMAPIAKLFGSDVVTDAAFGSLMASPAVDGTKAARELDHSPRPTDETVRDLVAFFVETGQLRRSAPR